MTPQSVLDFWFGEIRPEQQFSADPAVDEMIRSRFGSLHSQASRCELFAWRSTPEGRLAEIVVLDQFSRSIYRGTPTAFAADPLALALAQEAIRAGDDERLSLPQRAFLYLPFMHSESRRIHEFALRLFAVPGLEENYRYEVLHKNIIDRFGRYPHRNKALGRESTPEEIEFLKQPGSRF